MIWLLLCCPISAVASDITGRNLIEPPLSPVRLSGPLGLSLPVEDSALRVVPQAYSRVYNVEGAARLDNSGISEKLLLGAAASGNMP